jgi:hypothetical protein
LRDVRRGGPGERPCQRQQLAIAVPRRHVGVCRELGRVLDNTLTDTK